MKLVIRIVAITLIAVAALEGTSLAKAPEPSSTTYSSVPGTAGPMPQCNPFKDSNCSTIR